MSQRTFPTTPMTPAAPTKERGLRIARQLKDRCAAAGIPVEQVYLFGSLARGDIHRWSDVDIAVVYRPFLTKRGEERARIRAQREHADVPMDIVCLRTEDWDNGFISIGEEVRRAGIPV
jgi:predicted nucleotidyltransferase